MSYATSETPNTSTTPADTSATAAPMNTVLSEFCNAFQDAFVPLLEPVDAAAEALAAAPGDLAARSVLGKLRDLRHQMQALTDKVTEQQAYVLIFGPLKSGKSTFMNALSATYVSEVTSLPAYPCMVYVTHSDTPTCLVTHYDGRTTTYADRDALRDLVETGHHDLTERIREIEAAGREFDPATHMPEAIRRIDVRIPIDDLAQSGAALVDTPGLYTRMKFGYEAMTRDFRNSAACAIFIVKTDNLFLEQVFDEFGELLELFSRIFLVVNVDSTKMDLTSDGSLAPSLEQRDPWQVVQAFEDLSMTGPLKKAFEEGRLEIYPVDLLRAASRRIVARSGQAPAEPAAAAGGQAEFDDVLRDLTQFLNSNEYLHAFVADSLRRSRSLVDELGAVSANDAVQTLARDVEALEAQRDEARAQAVVLDRLRQVRWRDNVERLAARLDERVAHHAGRITSDASAAVGASVDAWFEGPHSLFHLLDAELAPHFDAAHARCLDAIRTELERRMAEDLTLVAGELDALTDLDRVGIDIRAEIAAVLDGLDPSAAAAPRPHLSGDEIPVRRSASDWLLLRSGTAVRERLLGPAAHRDAGIAPAVKARRLGEPCRAALRETLTHQLESALATTARDLPEQLLENLAAELDSRLSTALEQSHTRVKERLRDAEQRLREVEHAHGALDALAARLESMRSSVDALVARFDEREGAADAAV